MLAQKINKGPDAGAYRSVTVINRTEGHLYRQALVCHQLD